MLTQLFASATFSNGSTWAGEFNFTAYKVIENTYINSDKWLSCTNEEWYTLPSGNMVCHVAEFQLNEGRKKICKYAGGYLAEITTRDDAQALLYVMHKLSIAGKKSSNRFAVGAKAQNGRWLWGNSGREVELGIGEILKPEYNTDDISPNDGNFLYMKLRNQPTDLSTEYMNSLPYFDIIADPGTDAEEEFLCMKKGKYC